MKYAIRKKNGVHYLSNIEFDKEFNCIITVTLLKETDEVMVGHDKSIVKKIIEYLGNDWELVTVKEVNSYQAVEEK